MEASVFDSKNLRGSLAGVFLLLGFAMAGCQKAPTRTQSTDLAVVDPKTEAARILALEPVILDVRAPLDYGVSHVPGAVNVVWSDFSRPGARDVGVLDADHFALARRLALWGVTPDRPVLIVGFAGDRNGGEAARVAWMLRFLGVERVFIGSDQIYRGTIPRGEVRPRNATTWIPQIRAELQISVPDFLARAGAPQRTGVMTKARQQALGGLVVPVRPTPDRVIVDVREDDQREPLPTDYLHPRVIRKSWRSFFLSDGRLRPGLKREFLDLGVPESSELMVVGEDGLQGSAAAFALEEAGWQKVGAVSAGWAAIRRALASVPDEGTRRVNDR